MGKVVVMGKVAIVYFFAVLTPLISGAISNRVKDNLVEENGPNLPLVVTTWSWAGFQHATANAWNTLERTRNRLLAVVEGCRTCEREQCHHSVGFGNSPDDTGETTLDALLMDGPGHKMGAVGDLRRVKEAARVAWAVMNYTTHSFLAGESATQFALQMGFKEESLSTAKSKLEHLLWLRNNCQPNFRQNVSPDPTTSCGPYKPAKDERNEYRESYWASERNHDTIGIVVVDQNSDISVGTSTSGATNKIHGRVGDSPIPGAGAYVDNEVGGAAATGDGDIMMRFLPSYQTVENMRLGMSPTKAAEEAMGRIVKIHPAFSGAIVAASKSGAFGAACVGLSDSVFRYSVFNRNNNSVQLPTVRCM